MANFKPAEDFGGGYFDSNDIENHDGEQSFKTARGANSDLSRRRFAEYLGPDETHNLIRAYQAGDRQAGDRLTRAYTRLVRKCAKRVYGPSHDDLIAAGMNGLTKAFRNFDLRRNNAFATYAETVIRGHILDLTRRWRQQGMGDDRASRYLFARPNVTAEEVAGNCHISLETARAAIDSKARYRNGHDRYDTTEPDGESHDGISLRDNNTYNLAPHLKHSDLALSVRNDPAVEALLRNISSQSYGGNPARAAYFVDAGAVPKSSTPYAGSNRSAVAPIRRALQY